MKRYILPILSIFIFFASCKRFNDLLTIHKDLTYSYEADIPVIPNTGVAFPPQGVTVPFPKYTVVTNSTTFIEENNTNPDLLTSVKASKLSVMLLKPEEKYLNFIDSIRVYVSADGLSEQLAAYKYGIPNNSKTVDLTCEGVELKEYFLKDSMYFRIVAHFVNYPDSNSRVQINAVLSAAANPLNKKK